MDRRNFLFTLPVVLGLAACGTTWQTEYSGLDAEVSRNWRLSQITVNVPDALTVSEADTLAPVADIVWRGEAEGDRRAQVGRILTESATAGAAGLSGPRPVNLEVELVRFHGLTERAQRQLTNSGVHDIKFNIRVVDAATGALLAQEDGVTAPLIGLVGPEAVEAAAAGNNERVRIVNHLSAVFANWLGTGPDARGSFTRRGS
jgi:hypothetical protein